MAVVSYQYYTSTFLGDSVTSEQWAKYEKRAEDLIRSITHGVEIDSLPEDSQDAYKAAICYQVDYFAEIGLSTALTGSTASSYSIGRIRVENGSNVKGAASMVSPAAISILTMSGLLFRGVAVRGCF